MVEVIEAEVVEEGQEANLEKGQDLEADQKKTVAVIVNVARAESVVEKPKKKAAKNQLRLNVITTKKKRDLILMMKREFLCLLPAMSNRNQKMGNQIKKILLGAIMKLQKNKNRQDIMIMFP